MRTEVGRQFDRDRTVHRFVVEIVGAAECAHGHVDAAVHGPGAYRTTGTARRDAAVDGVGIHFIVHAGHFNAAVHRRQIHPHTVGHAHREAHRHIVAVVPFGAAIGVNATLVAARAFAEQGAHQNIFANLLLLDAHIFRVAAAPALLGAHFHPAIGAAFHLNAAVDVLDHHAPPRRDDTRPGKRIVALRVAIAIAIPILRGSGCGESGREEERSCGSLPQREVRGTERQHDGLLNGKRCTHLCENVCDHQRLPRTTRTSPLNVEMVNRVEPPPPIS